MLVELSYDIEGVSPLLMHNGQTADPLNKFAKDMKALSGQRKKTDETYAEMSRIEWHASLYVDRDGYLILPSFVIESAIIEGAKKQKLGKAFKSAVFVDKDARLDIGKKCKAIDLWGDDQFRDVRGVRVNQSRVMRTRAIFPQWKATIVVSFDDEQLNEAEVTRAVVDTGRLSGLCDYRPKYGRFAVVG